jgi:hypothetical protein
MHDHEYEDHQSDDGVIGGPRVTQILARKEHRRDHCGEETKNQRKVHQPSIPGERLAG